MTAFRRYFRLLPPISLPRIRGAISTVGYRKYTPAMQWYYVRDNQRQGPISEAEFQSLVASGVIQADTLVWRQGMAE